MQQPVTTAAPPKGASINTLMVLGFVLVALVPISILGFKIYNAAWENAWREVREKHQLLAENLASPLSIYVGTHQELLALTADLLQDMGHGPKASAPILKDSLDHAKGLRALLLLDAGGRILESVARYPITDAQRHQQWFKQADFFQQAVQQHQPVVSPVVINPITGHTTLFLATPLARASNPAESRVLVGELSIELIESLRQRIRFGANGHSAIVDQLGHVIAHPNPDWMKDHIIDLSNLSVVKQMMAGKTGVTEFFSPFIKDNMVAGYTAVPGLGWGVMVPQPKWEVEQQVRALLMAQLGWGIFGAALALACGFLMARWITRPINTLAQAGRQLHETAFQSGLPALQRYAPREIQQLNSTLGGAVNELITSRGELAELNRSLQERVDQATANLREANSRLEQLAKRDHLTQLANRRYFELTVANLASRRQGDGQHVCMLLLDVDKFKEVNDQYGHAAGDAVLMQIGEILRQSLRQSDLAARYAGDEFVILMRAGLDDGRTRAAQLREAIDRHQFMFEDHTLHTTVSIGLVSCSIDDDSDNVQDILRRVDEAMYVAKHQGRNRIAEVPLKLSK
jgi:diguanylate cyclase (GGDEF)-like protein